VLPTTPTPNEQIKCESSLNKSRFHFEDNSSSSPVEQTDPPSTSDDDHQYGDLTMFDALRGREPVPFYGSPPNFAANCLPPSLYGDDPVGGHFYSEHNRPLYALHATPMVNESAIKLEDHIMPKLEDSSFPTTSTKREREGQRKRGGEEIAAPKPTKRRKADESLVESYIAETMSKLETSQRFAEFVRVGKVEIGEDVLKCHLNGCGKTFKARHHLKRHVDEIHVKRRYKCLYENCPYSKKGKDFRQKSQCREHVKNVHFQFSSEWSCCFCSQRFTRWNGVKRHLELNRCRALKKQGRVMSATEVLEYRLDCKSK